MTSKYEYIMSEQRRMNSGGAEYKKAMAKDIDMVGEIYDRILDNEERTGKVYTNWKKDSIPQK